jgi:orotate phosphoribosyltransferase
MHAISTRRGHFVLESGLHTDTWLDLDTQFLDPAALEPQLDALTGELRRYEVSAVCGPLVGGALVAQAISARLGVRFYYTERVSEPAGSGLFNAIYRLPAGLRLPASHERFAVVDDAISAGSATRATVAELSGLGARTVVVGALLLLGDRGARHFAELSIPVVAAARDELSLWDPNHCPLCQAGVAVERRY